MWCESFNYQKKNSWYNKTEPYFTAAVLRGETGYAKVFLTTQSLKFKLAASGI